MKTFGHQIKHDTHVQLTRSNLTLNGQFSQWSLSLYSSLGKGPRLLLAQAAVSQTWVTPMKPPCYKTQLMTYMKHLDKHVCVCVCVLLCSFSPAAFSLCVCVCVCGLNMQQVYAPVRTAVMLCVRLSHPDIKVTSEFTCWQWTEVD